MVLTVLSIVTANLMYARSCPGAAGTTRWEPQRGNPGLETTFDWTTWRWGGFSGRVLHPVPKNNLINSKKQDPLLAVLLSVILFPSFGVTLGQIYTKPVKSLTFINGRLTQDFQSTALNQKRNIVLLMQSDAAIPNVREEPARSGMWTRWYCSCKHMTVSSSLLICLFNAPLIPQLLTETCPQRVVTAATSARL